MRIIIEDYNGNDLCELHIDTFTDLCQIENLIGCNIADVDTDEKGKDYLRVQLNKENKKVCKYCNKETKEKQKFCSNFCKGEFYGISSNSGDELPFN